MSALIMDAEADDRFRTVLVLTFAALATLLATVGVFGVEGRDPATYVGVVVLLVFVCFGAAFLPAMRVAKIAPMEVISTEE
jgi:hypothetical protein